MKAVIHLELTTKDKTFNYVFETNSDTNTLDVRGLEVDGANFRPVFQEQLPLEAPIPLDIAKISTAVAFALSRHTL